MKKSNTMKAGLALAVLGGALAPTMVANASAEDTQVKTTTTEDTQENTKVDETVPTKTFTDEEKEAIQSEIDTENNTRQSLIQEAVQTNDWGEYRAFEAKKAPAWFVQNEQGGYEYSKIFYGNILEMYVFNMREANAKAEQAVDGSVEEAEGLEQMAFWENEIQKTLVDFKNAPGIVPYVIGINSNDDYAKQYGVEKPADGFFDSKYNYPTVMSNGAFKTEVDNKVETEVNPTPEIFNVVAEVPTETEVNPATEVSEKSEETETIVDEVAIIDDGVFTEEEKTVIQAKIDTENNTRQSLIQEAVQTDDWSKYRAFEAEKSPAWFVQNEQGGYEYSKIFYGNILEMYVFNMREANAKAEQAVDGSAEETDGLEQMAFWENEIQKTLVDFKNAPGIVPYVIGINSDDDYAKQYSVDKPADGFFDSKYNYPTVMSNGTFKK